jgi:hypothetical protein
VYDEEVQSSRFIESLGGQHARLYAARTKTIANVYNILIAPRRLKTVRLAALFCTARGYYSSSAKSRPVARSIKSRVNADNLRSCWCAVLATFKAISSVTSRA